MPLCPGVDKGFADHLNMAPFVDPNRLATQTFDFITILIEGVGLGNPTFVAAEYFAMTNFVILPQFSLTSSTFDG